MKKIVALVLIFDLLALLYGSSTLSIGIDEAKIYFTHTNLLYYLTHASTFVFGQNDLALRLPLLILHVLSCILLYLLALKITKTPKDALFSLILFVLLPGSVASALLVNQASLVILMSLLILCAYEYEKKYSFYVLLCLAFFVDPSVMILYLALFFFGFYKKDALLWSVTLILFGLCLSFYGFDTGGKPKTYFLDTLGIFAACFSPLVFVYFFYVIYRIALSDKKPLLWFVMATTFVFCCLVSIRQKLYLEDFLPFCVISTPLLIRTLMQSYRVRLPNLRVKYDIFIQCSLIFLILCYAAIVFNTFLYAFISNPKKHFAYNYHGVKELALKLNEMGIKGVKTNENLALRLKFYGIDSSKTYRLIKLDSAKNSNIKVQIASLQEYYRLERIKQK
ncbi:hypothetical protein CQA38_07715 [Campylobacter sp. MIT 12-5580]|uniref:glycosyltransferase family 39 protein n=1 Tax=Campylobacter sp. MIT 12-5580 TaxID=2040651 RepID=UPI0010F4AF64|nr:glycosyltransferase family 39 protein [Campylobacter sp. MIT 12-5580]TKX28393.1 hypothetical protein CQA38_07715 [Campylobacter sp. MIT 12-5580]